MDKLLKHVHGLMNANAPSRAHWNRMTENEKKSFAVYWYRRNRMRNWNHLPAEMKLECIKTLDFKDRLKLRATARQERELVDSQIIDFPFVQFSNPAAQGRDGLSRRKPFRSSGIAEVRYPTPHTSSETDQLSIDIFNGKKYMSAIHLLAYTLKIGKIEKLNILDTYSPKRFDNCAKILKKSGPFRVKNLEIVARKTAVLMFLKNVEPGLDTIRLDADNSYQFPMDELVEIPAVTSCKLLQIKDMASSRHPVKLVKKWIENDSPVGTKFQASIRNCGSEFVNKFEKAFVEKIVSHQANQVRIRTNNAAKHVLLKWRQVERDSSDHRDSITCTIISSDFEDSEEAEDVVSWWSSCDSIGYASQFHTDPMWDESDPESDSDPLLAILREECVSLRLAEKFSDLRTNGREYDSDSD